MHKRQGLFLDALLLRQQLSEFLPELQVAREEQEQEQEQEQRGRVGSAQACPWTRNVCKCCASLLAGGSIGAHHVSVGGGTLAAMYSSKTAICCKR